MALRLPPYQPLPPPGPDQELLELPIASLQPTQLCVGLAEVSSRIADFSADNPAQQPLRAASGRDHPVRARARWESTSARTH